ncbi:hypothetical protein HHI36_002989 [Cryptolaemus montrouzieri]|uniref:ACAD9/ACADV-like C-terminal domain-containing protein n=1 Tax=Cryptolaemus montrouzieri TaxID=559131 RepID=A0ABD2PCL6_9CUCU
MIYLTSGLMSTFEDQDCELESLITKVYSSELALKSTEIGFSLLGISSINSEHFCQKLHQEALSNFCLYEHENMMRILIALFGLQYSGKQIGETVKKLRNPFFNGPFVLKKLWQNRKLHKDDPKLTIGLKNHLHPSCQEAANLIEYSILRLMLATETLFGRHGIDILNNHCQLRRLANVAIQIYAMIACVTRASRSYCIGLQHSDLEILISKVICKNGTDLVKKNVSEILYEYDNADRMWGVLTDNLYKSKNYYFAHPLARNF